MNLYDISYVYGGRLPGGEAKNCLSCRNCLKKTQPPPGQRLTFCPVCLECSIDCSHFVSLIYQQSGLDAPYLTTRQMLSLPLATLYHRYHLLPVDGLERARSGDLLVCKGHVALLERRSGMNRGDIIHATGGQAIREPGQGIQRRTNVDLRRFCGALKKILRHKKLFIINDLTQSFSFPPDKQDR